MKKINLEDIVDSFKNCLENIHMFVDKESGELEAIMDDALQCAKNEKNSCEEWMMEQVLVAKEVLKDKSKKRFVKLPSTKPFEDFDLINEFANLTGNEKRREELLKIIKDNSYASFITILERDDLFEEWYAFEDEQYFIAAAKWCNENAVQFE